MNDPKVNNGVQAYNYFILRRNIITKHKHRTTMSVKTTDKQGENYKPIYCYTNVTTSVMLLISSRMSPIRGGVGVNVVLAWYTKATPHPKHRP